MTAMALAQMQPHVELPFLINDADNHFVEPRDLYVNYVDPKWRHKAVTFKADEQGRWVGVFGGRPSRLNQAVALVATDDEAAAEVAARAVPTAGDENQMKAGQSNIHSPGMTLSRLNPYRNLTMDERIELIAYFRDQEESWGNRDLRLALMDSQGIGAALMFPNQVLSLEYEFADDVDGIYANTRAYNRWINEEIGWGYRDRLFLPAYVSLADPDEAVAEVELVLNQGATVIQIISGHAHGGRHNPRGGRSMADPVYDGFWARINEAEARVVTHLGPPTTRRTGPTGAKTPKTGWASSTPSNGCSTGATAPPWKRWPPWFCTTCSAASPTSRCACRSRAPCGCPTSSARWTTPSSWAGGRSGARSSTAAPATSSATTSSWRPSPRRTWPGW